jgi:hypothetical protein
MTVKANEIAKQVAQVASDAPRQITRAQRRKLDRAVAEHAKRARALIEQADREARAAGKRGTAVEIARGWVVHPDDRGALKRRRRKR